MNLSKFVAVGALSLSLAVSGSAQAGGLAEPLLEPEVIAQETAGSSGFLIPLVLLAIIAAVLLIDGGNGASEIVSPGDL